MTTFNTIPNNLRVPLVWVENQLISGGTPQQNPPLFIGQRLAAGTEAAGTVRRVGSAALADAYYGAGSLLARMVRAWYATSTVECYATALDDAAGSVARTATITFTVDSVQAGIFYLELAGQLIRAIITADMTATQVAAAVVAAVTAAPQSPMSAANVAGVVTLTARNKGPLGNNIDIRWNRLGVEGGQAMPVGLTAVLANGTEGSGSPVLADAIAVMGERAFDFVIHPYTDTENLTAMTAEFDDTTGRWSALRHLLGHVFTAKPGTYGARADFGDNLNDVHLTVHGYRGADGTLSLDASPTPPWEWAAACTAALINSLRSDPAAPLWGLPVKGVIAPLVPDTTLERQTQLLDGIATTTVSATGDVQLERIITTMQTDATGAETDAGLDITTPFTVMFLWRDLQSRAASTFRGFKVVGDGEPAGDKRISPKGLRAWAATQYVRYQSRGLVENLDGFLKELDVVRNPDDPTRLDMVFPPDLVNPLQLIAIQMRTRLQS